MMDQLKSMLETFIYITETVSQRNTYLILQVITLIVTLDGDLATMAEDKSLNRTICWAAKCASGVLNKYYSKTDETVIFRISMILHPTHKLRYFKLANWEQSWIDEAVRCLHDVWNSHYKPRSNLPTQPIVKEKKKRLFDALNAYEEEESRDAL